MEEKLIRDRIDHRPKSSCNHFMVSAYFKNCKININVNKGMNMMFSLKNALLLLIREGVNKSCLLILVSLFKVFKYVLLIFQLRNELTRD